VVERLRGRYSALRSEYHTICKLIGSVNKSMTTHERVRAITTFLNQQNTSLADLSMSLTLARLLKNLYGGMPDYNPDNVSDSLVAIINTSLSWS